MPAGAKMSDILHNYYKAMAMNCKTLIFTTILATLVSISLTGCVDESMLQKQIDDLSGRVSNLENMTKQMNANISSLQGIASALQENDYIETVTPIAENGTIIGYTITFTKNDPIDIYFGKDGINGIDGEDGNDGHSPQINIRQDSDGIYYWIIDGAWLLDDDGNKIKAEGISPELKITDGRWMISTDNGKTWSDVGQATGETLFEDVEVTDAAVFFTMSDGQTFTIMRFAPLSILFDAEDLVAMAENSTRKIRYTIISEDDDKNISIEAVSSSDIKAKIEKEDKYTGNIAITTGPSIDEYSKVVVFVSDDTRVIMKSIHFEAIGLIISDNDIKEIDSNGGTIDLEFLSNTECHAEIPEEAQSWISVIDTKALTQQSIRLSIAETTEAGREANITVRTSSGNLSIRYTIKQHPNQAFQDREALIALYNALDGPNWSYGYNTWCTDLPIDSWKGVTTDETGAVVSLSLNDSRCFKGTLPPEIGDFLKLKSLQIFSYDITGPIPPEIGNLKNLDSLKIDGVRFSSIPKELGNLSNLRYLRITERGETMTSGPLDLIELPDEIGNLSKLEEIELQARTVTIPSGIGGLVSLRELDIIGHVPSLPSEIGNLSSIESISIYDSGSEPESATIAIPSEIANLNTLQSLGIMGVSSIPPSMDKMSSLKVLSLSGNFSYIPPGIGNMENLTSLSLSGNYASLPLELGYLGITHLKISSPSLTSIPGEIFSNNTNLEHLSINIESSDVAVTIPPEINKLTKLTSLHLSGQGISGEFPELKPSPVVWFQNLESAIINNTNLTGAIPEMHTVYGDKELEIDFSNNKFSELPETGDRPSPPLWADKINLSHNQLSASIEETLASIGIGVKTLDISNNYLTGEIPSSISSFTNLEYLDLSHNQLSGEVPVEMRSLGNFSGKLRFLDLSYNNLTGNPQSALLNSTSFDTLRINGNRFSGTIRVPSSTVQQKWDYQNDILPQQDGYGLIFD